MAEKVRLLGPANVSSLTDGTHSMPSLPNLMGQADIMAVLALFYGEKMIQHDPNSRLLMISVNCLVHFFVHVYLFHLSQFELDGL